MFSSKIFKSSDFKFLKSFLYSTSSFNYILEKIDHAKAKENSWNPKAGKANNTETSIKEMKANFLTIQEDLKKWDDNFLQKLKRKKCLTPIK